MRFLSLVLVLFSTASLLAQSNNFGPNPSYGSSGAYGGSSYGSSGYGMSGGSYGAGSYASGSYGSSGSYGYSGYGAASYGNSNGNAQQAALFFRDPVTRMPIFLYSNSTGSGIYPFYAPPSGLGSTNVDRYTPHNNSANLYTGSYGGGSYLSGSAASTGSLSTPGAKEAAASPSMPETRRDAFDKWLRDKQQPASAPDPRRQGALQRALNAPDRLDILNGTAANAILEALRSAPERWKAAPALALDADTMNHLNFARVGSNGQGSFALLDRDGKLSWPKAFRTLQPAEQIDKTRAGIEADLRKAYTQATGDKPVEADLLAELSKAIDSLADAAIAARGALTFEEYLTVKKFLAGLEESVTFLQQPDARKFLPGRARPEVASVQQLVSLMTEKGLQFAPALPGSEEAYFKLHRKLGELYGKQ